MGTVQQYEKGRNVAWLPVACTVEQYEKGWNVGLAAGRTFCLGPTTCGWLARCLQEEAVCR